MTAALALAALLIAAVYQTRCAFAAAHLYFAAAHDETLADELTREECGK